MVQKVADPLYYRITTTVLGTSRKARLSSFLPIAQLTAELQPTQIGNKKEQI